MIAATCSPHGASEAAGWALSVTSLTCLAKWPTAAVCSMLTELGISSRKIMCPCDPTAASSSKPRICFLFLFPGVRRTVRVDLVRDGFFEAAGKGRKREREKEEKKKGKGKGKGKGKEKERKKKGEKREKEKKKRGERWWQDGATNLLRVAIRFPRT